MAAPEEDAQADRHHHQERPGPTAALQGEGEPDDQPDKRLDLEGGGAESVSCASSMQSRLPTPKVWASTVGSCPRTLNKMTTTNFDNIEEQPESEPLIEDAKDAKIGIREKEQEGGEKAE
jgi:hypothetical protein